MTAPEGCVLCEGLKGAGAAPGAGDLKALGGRPGDVHNVRRTAPPAKPVGHGRPHKTTAPKAKGHPVGWPFALML